MTTDLPHFIRLLHFKNKNNFSLQLIYIPINCQRKNTPEYFSLSLSSSERSSKAGMNTHTHAHNTVYTEYYRQYTQLAQEEKYEMYKLMPNFYSP